MFSLALLAFIPALVISASDAAVKVTHTAVISTNILGEILRLQSAVTNMSWELQLTKTDLKNTKTDLKNTKTDLKNTKTDLKNTKTDLKTTKASLKSTEDKLTLAMSRLSRVNSIDERLEEISNMTEKMGGVREISFQVKQVKNPYTPGENEALKFDDVTRNEGEGYNPTSGIFTVPQTGTFLCWANILSYYKNYFAVRLMKEGQEIVRGYTGNDQKYGTSSITYLMKCEKGEHVRFELKKGDTLKVHGVNYSSYGCYLMNK